MSDSDLTQVIYCRRMIVSYHLILFVSCILFLLVSFTGICLGLDFVPEEIVLRNGMRCLIYEDHTAPVFTLMIWIKTGSKHDPPGKSGLAHFLEHFLFQGSKSGDRLEFQKRIYRGGGRTNAVTGHDYTFYYCTFPVGFLEETILKESARIFEPLFDANLVEKEKNVVRDEHRRDKDLSYGVDLYDELLEITFPGTIYAHPILGDPVEFDSITLQDAQGFHRTWYVPSNMVLVVAGDIQTKTVHPVLEKYFGNYNAGTVPSNKNAVKSGDFKEVRKTYKSSVTRFAIAYPAVKPDHGDYYNLFVAEELLEHRLRLRLKYWNFLCTDVSCQYKKSFDKPVIIIQGTARNKKSFNEIRKILDEVVTSLDTPIEKNSDYKKELNSVKENMIAAYTKFDVSTYSIAWDLGYYFLFSKEGATYLDRFPGNIKSVSKNDIKKIADKYFSKDKRYAVIYEPE